MDTESRNAGVITVTASQAVMRKVSFTQTRGYLPRIYSSSKLSNSKGAALPARMSTTIPTTGA